MCFHWKSLRRQVRIRGPVEIVSDEEADAYYATRPRGSRIGAWASKQSRPLESRFALEKAVAEYTAAMRSAKFRGRSIGRVFASAHVDRILARPAVSLARPDGLQRGPTEGDWEQDPALSLRLSLSCA